MSSFVGYDTFVQQAVQAATASNWGVADGIKTLQLAVSDTDVAEVSQQAGNAVPNRIVIAIWNAGSDVAEIKENNSEFSFGQGWPIPAGQGLVIRIDEKTDFFFRCGSGNSSDLRIIQLSKRPQ